MTLHTKAMLASLHQAMWQAKATDRDIASQAERENEAEQGTLRVVKELTPREYLRPIKRIAAIGYEEHRLMTLPGLMVGQQLLAAASFDRYVTVQREIKERFWECVERFLDIYPDIVQSAPKRLGNAYKEKDFPQVTAIRGYFGYDIRLAPVPNMNNWFVEGLSGDDIEAVREQVKNEIEAMFETATMELFVRVREALTKLADQASAYDGSQPSLLRDVTIFHVKEIIGLLPEMNVTNDPLLTKIAGEMTDILSNCTARDIRADAALREKVANKAKGLVLKMPAAA